jgi:formylmethanofuran dehydrogenase subunit B
VLRGGGNRSGADAVLTWQTGFPMAVDFARGHPRYRPHDGHAEACLDSGGVDVVLLVGAATGVPASVISRMARVRAIAVGPRASEGPFSGGVAIDTGVAGIHDGGTALRMDDVPLPLRPSMGGLPATEVIVRTLTERIVASQGLRT